MFGIVFVVAACRLLVVSICCWRKIPEEGQHQQQQKQQQQLEMKRSSPSYREIAAAMPDVHGDCND